MLFDYKSILSSKFPRLYYLYKLINTSKYKLLQPIRPSNRDVYLVSFPKSGATWVDVIIANILTRLSGMKQSVTFLNVHQFIPDIHETRDIQSVESGIFPYARFIKSHAPFNPGYRVLFYIVRDPRSVMVSYYEFLRQSGKWNHDFKAFIKSETYGLPAWTSHVNSWFRSCDMGIRFNYLKYEEIHDNPEATLSRVFLLLGFCIDKELIKEALECASFVKMSEMEGEYLAHERIGRKQLKFMRGGKKKGWADYFDMSDLEYLNMVSGDLMRELNYSL